MAYELEPGKVLFVVSLKGAPVRESLSSGEKEVLRLLLDGQSTASIAVVRGTSPRTVSNQIATIFKKLNVHSRAELAAKLFNNPLP